MVVLFVYSQYEVMSQGVIRHADRDAVGSRPSSDVVKKHVKRRYREFVNLHSRLEENLRLRQFVQSNLLFN